MYRNLKVGIAVPAYNEEKLIGRVIETMPEFVDLIIVVDDRSTDRTREVAESYLNDQGNRLIVLHHEKNTGVGGAVITAYKYAYTQGMDVAAVMAGDAQMMPEELTAILDPIAENEADYTKGNRLADETVWRAMPRFRFFGNHLLSLLTKIASGYWHINDSQAGYTALSRNAIKQLNLDIVSHGYQFENSMLVHLNILGLRVVNVAITPVYGIGEKSTIVVWKAGIEMAWYLLIAFIERIWKKYYLRNFHPIILLYVLGVLSFIPGILLGLYLVITRFFTTESIAITSALFAVFLTLIGMQFLLAALFMDMSSGRKNT
jgi:glycosyltransferase involved in cell wall biosynthesis